MNQNPTTRAVTHMDIDEITTFRLYRDHLANGGLTRDRLPYTTQFDALLADYNQNSTQAKTHQEFWTLLELTLKVGEPHIEDYLTTQGITYTPKP